MPIKCALGCKKNAFPLHVFPNPSKDPKRFRAWLEVVGDDVPRSFSDEQIFKRLRVCDRHFLQEHRARFRRLTAMAVPQRGLNAATPAEPESTTDESKPLENDEETVEVYRINGESGCIDIELDDKDSDDDDVEDPDTPESAEPNDSDTDEYLIENGDLTESPSVTTGNDTGPCTLSGEGAIISNNRSPIKYTPEMAKYYHRKWSMAQKKLEIQSNQLKRMRRDIATQRLSKKQALDIVARGMTPPAKLFFAMQTKGRTDKFSMEEKSLSYTIYKKSPKCYQLLTDYFVLPSAGVMERIHLDSMTPLERGSKHGV